MLKLYCHYNSDQSGLFFLCIILRCLKIQNHHLVLLATTYFSSQGAKTNGKNHHKQILGWKCSVFEHLIWGDIREWQVDKDKEQPPQPPPYHFLAV